MRYILFIICFTIIILFYFLYKFCCYIPDRRTNKNKLRIMQYNVEWLFLDKSSNRKCPGEECRWKNKKNMLMHLKFVSNIIKKLNPDIINLCEIKNYNSINGLLNYINNFYNDSYKGYFIQNKKNLHNQNVGLITKINPLCLFHSNIKTKYPVKNSTCNFEGYQIKIDFKRHYIAEFCINNINIVLISVHLKAFSDEKSCAKKEAQALIISNIILNYRNNINNESKNYEFIVIGDINDFDNNNLDVHNNKSSSLVFDIFEKECKLYNLNAKIKKEHRYTEMNKKYRYFGNYYDNNDSTYKFSLLDYCLVSHNLINKVSDVFIYKDFDIWNKYNSDHLPLVIDFEF